MKEKFCKECRQTLSITHFNPSKNVKDGYENKCKKCRQEARKKHIKVCVHCQNEFKTDKKQAKFCSSKCHGASRRKRVKKTCSYCGEVVEVKPSLANKHEHHYCDQDCRTEHLKILMKGSQNPNYNRVDYDCDGCGKGMKVVPSRLNLKHLFCSYECYKKNIGKFYTGKNNHNYVDYVMIECDNCGILFGRKPGEINKTGNNYCSRKCHAEKQLVPTGITYYEHSCAECKKIFKTQVKDSKFCSRDCKNIYQGKHIRGNNHPLYNPNLTNEERKNRRKYTEYYEWREAVYKRDGYTCQCCGDRRGGNLVAHHILNYSEHKELRTEIDNGITLCKRCHKNFHDKYGYTNNNKQQLHEFIINYKKAPIPL